MLEYKNLSRRLTKNMMTLLGFEGVFKLLTVVLAVPIFSGFLKLTMWLTGYHYLTAENIPRFLTHPLFLICAFFLLMLMVFYLSVDMGAVIYNLHRSYADEKTDIFHTFVFGLHWALKLFCGRNHFLMILCLCLMMPVFGIGFAPALLGNLLVRDILVKRLAYGWHYLVFFGLAALLLLVLFFRNMYAYVFMTLEDCGSREALEKSAGLSKGDRKWDILVFLLAWITFYLVYAGLMGVAMLIAVVCEKALRPTILVNSLSTSLMLTVTTVCMIFVAAWTAPASCSCIGTLYYYHKQRKGEAVPETETGGPKLGAPFRKEHRPLVVALEALILALSVAICGIYIFRTYRGRFNPNIEGLHQLEVTAHRGASRHYPENTMAAFRGALELGADWIELDIHQSKDGQLVVMHDSSLYRTCRVRKKVWELTWEELSQLDAGSFFSREFRGEKIPLLSDVIDFAKENHIRLNIELKPSKEEKGMEKRLVELIQEKDFMADCVVTSQKYTAITKVKAFDEAIQTVYVMGYAYGNVASLSAADAYSINMSSVSRRLVSQVHNEGKQIYAWTVNRRFNIEDMMERNVDNVITDDVSLAKTIVGEKRAGNALHEYIRWLNKWFR